MWLPSAEGLIQNGKSYLLTKHGHVYGGKTEVEAKCKVVCKHARKYLHKNNTTKMPVESCDDGQGGYYPAVVAIVLLGNVAMREDPRPNIMNTVTLFCFCCLFGDERELNPFGI